MATETEPCDCYLCKKNREFRTIKESRDFDALVKFVDEVMDSYINLDFEIEGYRGYREKLREGRLK